MYLGNSLLILAESRSDGRKISDAKNLGSLAYVNCLPPGWILFNLSIFHGFLGGGGAAGRRAGPRGGPAEGGGGVGGGV